MSEAAGGSRPLGEPASLPEPVALPLDRSKEPLADRPLLEGRNLSRVYTEEDGSELTILHGVEIAVARAEAVAVIGASGAGKSTLLHLLGGLDRPSAGEVFLDGRNVSTLDDVELASVRNRRIGFVFQFHHLLREFSAVENVMMPMLIGGVAAAEAERKATDLLGEVGLEHRLSHKPTQLSGGEQQRVAVARALANQPAVVIADEPSGNLDTHTSEQLHELLFRMRELHGVALIVATHNRELADRADRILLVKDARLQSFYPA
ncbi:MAG TPA: ABC transporter ATP-binding protein [Longimicrobiales bacterium]|nr:ABC transporter ATP-binding protein [Longimicrobiales bacterium]